MITILRYACGVVLVGFALVSTGCTSNNNPTQEFDRKAMLADLSAKLIVPAYERVDAAMLRLQSAINAFTQAPSQTLLHDARQQWDSVAYAWMDAVSFDFGPAETLYGNLSVNIGTFPADSVGIEQFIASGDTALQNFERDTRGLYGIEYLLFAGSDQEIVDQFTGAGGQLRSAYLRSIMRRMYGELHAVYQEWTQSYATSFVSRNGTDAGSGTSELFNAMNISYEMIKNYKLGLPLGLRAGQTSVEPTKVEAYYSGRSIELITRHYHAVMNIWDGRALDGSKILGFKDYLQALPSGDRLIDETLQQRKSVDSALAAVPTTTPLSDQIVTNPQPAITLQAELQKLTRFLKSELSSLTGLAITYASGDGD